MFNFCNDYTLYLSAIFHPGTGPGKPGCSCATALHGYSLFGLHVIKLLAVG